MEPVYRRRSSEVIAHRRPPVTKVKSRKNTIAAQAFCSLLLLGVCLFIKTAPDESFLSAKNALQLILSTQTDFRSIPADIRQWVLSLLPGEEARNLGDSDVLTKLVKPVEAPVTSPFGVRIHPTTGVETFHYGVDLGAAEGEKILCAAPGEVIEAGESPDYGNYLVVRHSETIYTVYAHCAEVLPHVGDTVSASQAVATVGATGNVTGPHLHFEIRNGETWLNPAEFLEFGEIRHD